ncbi:MAG: DUF4258 domain-containing protein [Chloroflexota bacterium]
MSEPIPLFDFIFTAHALMEMQRRGIAEKDVAKTLVEPEQMEIVRPGRVVFQKKIDLGEPPKTYILRVFVDTDRKRPEVVTVYRTSKVEKYWR